MRLMQGGLYWGYSTTGNDEDEYEAMRSVRARRLTDEALVLDTLYVCLFAGWLIHPYTHRFIRVLCFTGSARFCFHFQSDHYLFSQTREPIRAFLINPPLRHHKSATHCVPPPLISRLKLYPSSTQTIKTKKKKALPPHHHQKPPSRQATTPAHPLETPVSNPLPPSLPFLTPPSPRTRKHGRQRELALRAVARPATRVSYLGRRAAVALCVRALRPGHVRATRREAAETRHDGGVSRRGGMLCDVRLW